MISGNIYLTSQLATTIGFLSFISTTCVILKLFNQDLSRSSDFPHILRSLSPSLSPFLFPSLLESIALALYLLRIGFVTILDKGLQVIMPWGIDHMARMHACVDIRDFKNKA